jgi:hypothetical protein
MSSATIVQRPAHVEVVNVWHLEAFEMIVVMIGTIFLAAEEAAAAAFGSKTTQ